MSSVECTSLKPNVAYRRSVRVLSPGFTNLTLPELQKGGPPPELLTLLPQPLPSLFTLCTWVHVQHHHQLPAHRAPFIIHHATSTDLLSAQTVRGLAAARWHVSLAWWKSSLTQPRIPQCEIVLRGHTQIHPNLPFYILAPPVFCQTHQNISRGINHRVDEQRRAESPHYCHRRVRRCLLNPFVHPSPCQRSMGILFTWWLPSLLEWPRCLCAQRGGPRRVLLWSITISNFSPSPWIYH
jgi:hypothetical protein